MSYYDAIASGYNNLHSEEQLQKYALIKQFGIIKNTDYLLDVGCGTGLALDYFATAKAVGIDPSKKLLQHYRGNATVLQAHAESIPFNNDTFDVVISITAAQNFSDLLRSLSEIHRVGKDKYIISVLKTSNAALCMADLLKQIYSGFMTTCVEQEKDFIYILKRHFSKTL